MTIAPDMSWVNTVMLCPAERVLRSCTCGKAEREQWHDDHPAALQCTSTACMVGDDLRQHQTKRCLRNSKSASRHSTAQPQQRWSSTVGRTSAWLFRSNRKCRGISRRLAQLAHAAQK